MLTYLNMFSFNFAVAVELLLDEMRGLREALESEIRRQGSSQSTSQLCEPKFVGNFSSSWTEKMELWRMPEVQYLLPWVALGICVWASLCNSYRLFLVLEGLGMPSVTVSLLFIVFDEFTFKYVYVRQLVTTVLFDCLLFHFVF
jgi:hypothetical protein